MSGRRGPALLVLAPMGSEARALAAGLICADALVHRSGIGPRRARRSAARLAALPAEAVAISGLAGALHEGLEPGDVVVADQLMRRGGERVATCTAPEALAAMLRGRGLRVRIGAIVSVRSPVVGVARRTLGETGALVVDMESVWLAPAAAGRPLAVARVVLDSPRRELANPWQTLNGLRRAISTLTIVAAALGEWGQTVVQVADVRD